MSHKTNIERVSNTKNHRLNIDMAFFTKNHRVKIERKFSFRGDMLNLSLRKQRVHRVNVNICRIQPQSKYRGDMK